MISKICYIILICLLFLVISLSDKGNCQSPQLFRGITDRKVLPLLKHLPSTYGGMNVPAVDGRLLYDTIVKKGYKYGLEIGTSNGYSSLWLGLAFKKTGGTLITLEIEPNRAREAQVNFKKAGLDHIIESRICDAFAEIPKIKDEFDFVFIDAWKSDYLEFFHLVKDRIKPGGVITAHNVSNTRGEMADFLQAIQSDSSFTTVIDKTSYAGVSLSFK